MELRFFFLYDERFWAGLTPSHNGQLAVNEGIQAHFKYSKGKWAKSH